MNLRPDIQCEYLSESERANKPYEMTLSYATDIDKL